MNRSDFQEIVNQARNKWPQILQCVGINIPDGGKHGPCPACGGKDRFRFDNKGGRGTWFCNQCGHGDGLDLVKNVLGKNGGEAARIIADSLPGITGNPTPAKRNAKNAGTVTNWRGVLEQTTSGTSHYLKQKGLNESTEKLTTKIYNVAGITFPVGSLALPVMNLDGSITGIQLINPQGEKALMPGSKFSGAFIPLSELPESAPNKIIITEGYATARTVALIADGFTVAAISASNLASTAKNMRERWADAQIVIAGDNDFKEGAPNKGREEAIKAALQVKGLVSIPPGRVKADWDDYRREYGLQRAREAFAEEMINPSDGEKYLPHGFRLTKEYLWFERQSNNDNAQTHQIKVCSPLRVTAITCNAEGGDFGRLLEWEDSNGVARRWAMPMTILAGGGQELREVLLENGLHFISVNNVARAMLMEYIANCRPVRKVVCVERTGWYEDGYVLTDEVIGRNADDVIFQATRATKNDFTVKGDTRQWVENIGRYCVGNSRLTFCVSLSFAAPLLALLGMEGGGFHLKGESTDGKTTTMKVAASVCGGRNYWKTWRATGNALESIALRRNDAPLMLDEIGEVDGREVAKIAYMLGNGQGKARSKAEGGLRDTATWSLLFLSTGEVSIAEHAADAGERNTAAGARSRMAQIPSDTGMFGAFENIHDFCGGKEFAEYLEQAVQAYHGAPFRDWLRWLSDNPQGVTNQARELRKKYERLLAPEGAGNQVGRVMGRFALIAAAGEMATEAGLTGWRAGDAEMATRRCIEAWIRERGHIANQEEADAVEKVRRFISANQFARFADWLEEGKNRPANMVGFRRVDKGDNTREAVTTFYILPTAWKEICGTSNPVKTAAQCAQRGWLMVSGDGKYQTPVRLPEIGSKRVYVFNSGVID
ncbi:DUF927 domain-containing protein [Escherichia coli]|uniref:DUF927 domain-containing protein n=1 Tax=Escherichia coli TaxID=562 RepID=UPI001CBFCEFC|nr:DUF927 domain-containing protein [Escherichia coli]MED0462918.1 DUF927 domain-containing protein [Escherichia coli]HBB8935540.1 DUF927 domain-containing protein [Escherichia coli]HDK0048427.1 DUF927 domain-containing protein [Escherichia coli]